MIKKINYVVKFFTTYNTPYYKSRLKIVFKTENCESKISKDACFYKAMRPSLVITSKDNKRREIHRIKNGKEIAPYLP